MRALLLTLAFSLACNGDQRHREVQRQHRQQQLTPPPPPPGDPPYSQPAALLVWSSRRAQDLQEVGNSSSSSSSPSSFVLTAERPSSSAGCLYDPITLRYETLSVQELRIAVVAAGSVQAQLAALHYHDDNHNGSTPKQQYPTVLQCMINEEHHCVPMVENIVAQTQGSPSIVVTFTQDTAEPSLLTSRALLEALEFAPPLVGGAVAEWVDARTLRIAVEPLYLEDVLARHRQQLHPAVEIRTRTSSVPFSQQQHAGTTAPTTTGRVTLRPQEAGKLSIFAVNATSLQRVSPVIEYEVRLCVDDTVVPREALPAPAAPPAGVGDAPDDAVPAVWLKGVLAVSGRDAVKIPQEAVPGIAKGSWALSFWVRLLSGPTGAYRALFFKGAADGDAAGTTQRTPSAWLLPHVNKLALRVSTARHPDLGTDTLAGIPWGEWVLLTFVFRNESATAAAAAAVAATQQGFVATAGDRGEPLVPATSPPRAANGSATYVVTTYVNGDLDVTLAFSDEVLGNGGPLELFKDMSHQGPVALVRDLVVWDRPLLPGQVRDVYTAGRHVARATYLAGIDDLQAISMPPPSPASSLLDYLVTTHTRASTALGSDADPAPQSTRTGGRAASSAIAQQLLQQAQEGRAACSLNPSQRLDLLAEASVHGSAEALYAWAMLLGMGAEEANIACGYDEASAPADTAAGGGAWLTDQARATVAHLHAVEAGHSRALVPLAISLLTGVGAEPFFVAGNGSEGRWPGAGHWDVPLPPWEGAPGPLHEALARAVTDAVDACRRLPLTPPPADHDLPLGRSALCPADSKDDGVTRLAMALLHVASALGEAEADAVLAHRYQHGLALPRDAETAAQYGRRAAVVSAENFHRVGAQPVLESDRVDDNTEAEIDKGKTGNDDEAIVYQRVRADEGDAQAQVATGDLLYYGARGVARDQPQALRYYSLAAAQHDPMGLCGAAAMHLKGEGTPEGEKNVTRALELYDEASLLGSVKALNGLGYIYFYGHEPVLPKNETKAFHYFLAASEYGQEGDSFTNAAYMLAHGIGVDKDKPRAARLYDESARRFGSFAAIHALSTIHLEAAGVARSPLQSLFFLTAANGVGPWAAWLRRGLDGYLQGARRQTAVAAAAESLALAGAGGGVDGVARTAAFRRALACYLFAAEFGFEVASSNAAFILRRKSKVLALLPGPDQLQHQHQHQHQHQQQQQQQLPSFRTVLQLRQLSLAAHSSRTDAYVAIGNVFFELAKAMKKAQAAKEQRADAAQRRTVKDVLGALQRRLAAVLPGALAGVSTTHAAAPVQPVVAVCPTKADASDAGSDNADDHDHNDAHGRNDAHGGNGSDDVAISAALGGRCAAVPAHECIRRCAAASVWWYSKASAAGDPLGSMYTGMMTQLGIGVPHASSWRAERYYRAALQQDAAGTPLQPQLKSLTKLLLAFTATTRDGHYLAWLTQPVEYFIQYIYRMP